jgi:SNF2 family DNA or RNA helicase
MEDQYTRAVSLLNGTLFDYQKEGVAWLLSMENLSKGPRGGFLCDSVGMGKSIQIISIILGNVTKEYTYRRTKIYSHTMGEGNYANLHLP